MLPLSRWRVRLAWTWWQWKEETWMKLQNNSETELMGCGGEFDMHGGREKDGSHVSGCLDWFPKIFRKISYSEINSGDRKSSGLAILHLRGLWDIQEVTGYKNLELNIFGDPWHPGTIKVMGWWDHLGREQTSGPVKKLRRKPKEWSVTETKKHFVLGKEGVVCCILGGEAGWDLKVSLGWTIWKLLVMLTRMDGGRWSRKEPETRMGPEEKKQHSMNTSEKLEGEWREKSLRSTWDHKGKVKGAPSCLTLWDPVDYTVHGILQTSILKWVAFPFSRGFFWTQGLNPGLPHCRWLFTSWATREAQEYCSG